MHNFVTTYLDMIYFKAIFFAFPLMGIGSFKVHADLPMAPGEGLSITETREFLLTGDLILLIGFVLWIAYIVFCFPKGTLKKL
jgi:hypothetical protein